VSHNDLLVATTIDLVPSPGDAITNTETD